MSSSSQLNRASPPQPRPDASLFRGKSGNAITVIELNIENAARSCGLERLGFLTLTFSEHVVEKAEASRRFNSLASNVLKCRYRGYMVVWERQASGRLHAHLLVGFHEGDIRSGVDFDALRRRDYRSAPAQLRAEWAFWRKSAPLYGFGRTELLPIRTTAGAMSNYVGKYLGKDFAQERDRGHRRYAASRSFASANQHHQSIHSTHWRAAMGLVAAELAAIYDVPATHDAITAADPGNSSWVWRHRELIAEVCDLHRSDPLRAAQRAVEGLQPVRITAYRLNRRSRLSERP